MPLVSETKMAVVDKLTSLRNLLARRVTWFVLTTTSVTLVLSRAFGADYTTRIAYIYSHFPRIQSFTFWLTHTHILSLSLSLSRSLSLSSLRLTGTAHTLSLSLSLSHTHTFWLPETAWPWNLVTQLNTRDMGAYTFYNLFFFFLFCLFG